LTKIAVDRPINDFIHSKQTSNFLEFSTLASPQARPRKNIDLLAAQFVRFCIPTPCSPVRHFFPGAKGDDSRTSGITDIMVNLDTFSNLFSHGTTLENWLASNNAELACKIPLRLGAGSLNSAFRDRPIVPIKSPSQN